MNFPRSTLTDVKIKCEGKILECHKAILSARWKKIKRSSQSESENYVAFQVFSVPGNVPARHEGKQEQRDHHPWPGLQHCQGHGALRLQWQGKQGSRKDLFFLWIAWLSLVTGWVTFQTSLTFFWVLQTSMTSGLLTFMNLLPLIILNKNIFADIYDLWIFPYQRLERGMLSIIIS